MDFVMISIDPGYSSNLVIAVCDYMYRLYNKVEVSTWVTWPSTDSEYRRYEMVYTVETVTEL